MHFSPLDGWGIAEVLRRLLLCYFFCGGFYYKL